MAQTRRRTMILTHGNDRTDDLLSISFNKTISSLEDSYETIQSYSDDSLLSDTQEIRRSRHYVKQSKSNRLDDSITSLKRRIRKQQLRYDQNEINNFPSSSTHLPLISNSRSTLTNVSSEQRKKSNHVVPLPPLINNARVIRIRVRGIRLNNREY